MRVFRRRIAARVALLLVVAAAVFSLPQGRAFAQPPRSQGAPESVLQEKMRMAQQLFGQGKDSEAEKVLLEIVAQDPRHVEAHNLLGILYGRTRRAEKSIAAFERVLELAPGFPGAYLGMGFAYRDSNDLQRALENFRKVVAVLPDNALAWLQIAIITDMLGQVEDSLLAYQRVLETAEKTSPEFRQAQDRLMDMGEEPEVAVKVRALMAEGTELSRAGKRAEAVTRYQEASALRPKSLTIRRVLAEEQAQAGDFAASEATMKEMIGIVPDNLGERFRLARFQALLGKRDDAMKSYQDLLSVAINRDERLPEVEPATDELFRLIDEKQIDDHLVKADVATLGGKWQDSINELRAAQAIDPYSPLILFNLLRVYQQAGYYDLAVSTAHELLLIEPASRDARLLLAKAHADRHQYVQASEQYVKVLSLSEGRQQEGLFFAEALVGVQDANVGFKKAVPQAISNYAKALRSSAKGETDAAIAFLKLAIAIAPDAPLMHYQLGQVYAETGDTANAIRELKEALKANPGSYQALLLLSELYVKERRWTGAVAAFETLLRLPDEGIKALGATRARLEEDLRGAREERAKAHERVLDLFKLGQLALERGDTKEAVSQFLSASYEEPDNPFVRYSLGVAYAANEDSKAAAKAFQDALELDPSNVQAKFRLGVVLEASELYGAATTQYREVVAMAEAKSHPEYAQAEERLQKVAERFKRLHRAETHAGLGFPVLTAQEEPSKERLTVALWHWQQSVKLDPDTPRYYYNLGLVREKAAMNKATTGQVVVKTPQDNLNLLGSAIEAYREAIRVEPTYLAAYLRIGQLYESSQSNDQALAIYKEALAVKSVPPTEQEPRALIQKQVDLLTRRLFVSGGFVSGFDNNLTLSDPRQEDFYNAVSLGLSYALIRKQKLQMSVGWQNQTSYYLRSQTLYNSNTFSGTLQSQFRPTLTGNFSARASQSFFKDVGLTAASSEETVGLTYYGRFPTINTFQYAFLGVTYVDNSSLNTLQHRATYSGSHRIFRKYDLSFGYGFTLNRVAGSPDNEFMSQQANVRVQWPLRPDLSASASVASTLQNFLHDDTFADPPQKRKNTLSSFGIGLTQRLAETTSLSVDIQVQRNKSDLGTSRAATPVDVLLGRSSSLGSYTKRVITLSLAHSF